MLILSDKVLTALVVSDHSDVTTLTISDHSDITTLTISDRTLGD